jgi:hypothetical protein
MFGWLIDSIRRWRRNRSRAVFRFFDGKRTRAVDPWAVYVALEMHPKYKHDMAEAIREGELEETEIAVAAASEIFGVPRYKNNEKLGLTDGELVELLASFVLYTTESKKKYDRLSTSLPATDGEFSNAATSAKTGPSFTDCGSISITPRHATPSASSAV